jgi:hypothetical protein
MVKKLYTVLILTPKEISQLAEKYSFLCFF